MIHKQAKKEGCGELLAEGAKRVAGTIGKGAENFVAMSKGCLSPCMISEGNEFMCGGERKTQSRGRTGTLRNGRKVETGVY